MSIQEYLARPRADCFDGDFCVLEISSQYFEPLNVWKLACDCEECECDCGGDARRSRDAPHTCSCDTECKCKCKCTGRAEGDLVTIVIFYVPWCHHCKELHDKFCEVARIAPFASFVAFNCEKQCKHFGKISRDMPFLVKSFPTIVGYLSQVPFEEFRGERTIPELLKFVGRLAVSASASSRDSSK